MTAMLRQIVIVLAIVVAIVLVVVFALGVRSPSIDVGRLPSTLPAGQSVTLDLPISDPGSAKLEFETSSQELEILAGDPPRLSWSTPTPGIHEHMLNLVQLNDGKREALDSVIWRVKVEAGDADNDALPDDTPTAGQPASSTEAPDTPEQISQPQPAPSPDLPQAPAPDPEPAAPASEQVAQPEAPTDAAPEPPPAPTPLAAKIESVDKLASEIVTQVGSTSLYGQGMAQAGEMPESYLADKLQRVTYTYQAPRDPQLADAHLDALLAIGGSYAQPGSPLDVQLNTAGRDALKARGQQAIRLPVKSWSIILHTTRQVGGVINEGSVDWRLARYAPADGTYAVVIEPNDIDKQD